MHQPKLLLADEPTGNLDSQTGQSIIDLLFQIHKENNMGLWCVTHDSNLSKRFDTTFTVNDGKVENNQ